MGYSSASSALQHASREWKQVFFLAVHLRLGYVRTGATFGSTRVQRTAARRVVDTAAICVPRRNSSNLYDNFWGMEIRVVVAMLANSGLA